MLIVIGIAVLALFVGLYFFLKGRPQRNVSDFDRLLGKGEEPRRGAAKSAETGSLAKLRQDLRAKCLHDEEKVRAAVEFEREQKPNGTEEELLLAAIYRWERLNR